LMAHQPLPLHPNLLQYFVTYLILKTDQ